MATDAQVIHYTRQAEAAQRAYDAQSEPDTSDYEAALEDELDMAWSIPETIMDALGRITAGSQEFVGFTGKTVDARLLASDCTGDELLVALFNGTERQAIAALHELRERMDAVILEATIERMEREQ